MHMVTARFTGGSTRVIHAADSIWEQQFMCNLEQAASKLSTFMIMTTTKHETGITTLNHVIRNFGNLLSTAMAAGGHEPFGQVRTARALTMQ